MTQAKWAMATARRLLSESLPQRWAHTQGVAARSRFLAPTVGENADLLEAAAWLHDIGYSPDLVRTHFHPLDGARHLRDSENAAPMLCRLVAHHSCAVVEAEERGLRDMLESEFATPDSELADALTFCDMTTGPIGAPTTVDERIAEILARYDCQDPTARAIRRAAQDIVVATSRVRLRLVKFL